ncbi:MAG TPA: M81 family metallopeptidase [Xanthobacteraceae bacterium]|nr:M81 family metallopeptidase [Xanthobacteraceae bacterium]
MRFLIAMMKHETNTFSPIPTNLQRFRDWGLYEGEAVKRAYKGTNHPTAAFLDLAEEAGADVVTPIAAEAMPSGPVHREAYEYLTGRILDTVAEGGIDAAFLDLHGAMAAEGEPDGEGGLLERLRRIAPGLPIAVTFDMHGNMSERIARNATIINGYKSYPHTDMYEAGMQAGRALLRALRGEVEPVIAWGRLPLLAQTLRMGTADEPMRTMQEMCRAAERDRKILAASVFGGFPMADIADAGLSAFVVADADREAAEAACERLLDAAWARKDDFIYQHEPLEKAVARAAAISESPVILLDHADNVGSGGTSDDMTVIAEVLRQGLRNVAVAAVWDPRAVQAMIQAGVGAELTLDLGGKTDMPSIGVKGRPLRLTGKVRRLSDGEWVVRGPMYTGSRVTTGPTALFETDSMSIVVTSLHHEPWDTGILTSLGVDPHACRYLLLKSRIHYRAGFAPIGKATVTLDGVGVTTSDNSLLKFEHVRRPIFPLDPMQSAPRPR